MARLAGTVRALAALLFFVGIVLLPLRAAAATVPMLIAYDAAALSTTTMPVERPDTVRREVEPASNDYDRACVGCDDPWNPPVAAGAADIHAYDDTLELLERRERANGAVYGFVEPTTAAEGAEAGMTTLYRTVAEGERAALEAGGSYEAAAGGVEGTYFYPTAEQAQALARANFSSQGVQTLTSVQVPNSVLQGATQLSVAGEGRVIFFTSEQLPGLARPSIWNFFPDGGGAGP